MMQWDDLSGAIAKGPAAVSNEQCNAMLCNCNGQAIVISIFSKLAA